MLIYPFTWIICIFAKKGTTMWNEMSNPAVLLKIGQRIKETRIRQRITQEELATASGVSPLTVANIEKGKSGSVEI